MKIEVGDLYVRNSDKRLYRVKNIDNKMVLLQEADGIRRLSLTNIFGLEKGYTKVGPKPIQIG